MLMLHAIFLAGAVLLAEVVRAAEADSEGMRLGDAEEEEELEEVSELELLEVPEEEGEPVCEDVRVAELLGEPVMLEVIVALLERVCEELIVPVRVVELLGVVV